MAWSECMSNFSPLIHPHCRIPHSPTLPLGNSHAPGHKTMNFMEPKCPSFGGNVVKTQFRQRPIIPRPMIDSKLTVM